MAATRKPLEKYRRIVIKIGSALLVERKSGLKKAWLDALSADIAALKMKGVEVLVVSSGAIALGRTVLNLPSGVLRLEDSQAAAAVGQIALARAWSESLSADQIIAGQILLTLGDTEERRRYLNARATINQLLKLGSVPIINENDTVATTEIRYGDNDRLAARVATMVGADLLVLLSDIDGLYTAPPHLDPEARFLETIAEITPEIEAMAGGAASELSRGGMRTKIDAGKIATTAGCAMIIASGKPEHPLKAIEAGARSSWFAPSGSPVTARKTWIAGQLLPAGSLTVDAGAETALRSGKSLLPAGVRQVTGTFSRGDTIAILGATGREIARGLAGYDVHEARQIAGKKSAEIAAILGYAGRAAMVHRDDLVMTAPPGKRPENEAPGQDEDERKGKLHA
ncbi:glutamate 5-kinase [Sinorhizobium alkalisoli]|uniref:Glutamate 5-kinase n=1 Tax=Sinorhizobium alkalisoli TaxID=1752398 RepID=A0A1E3VDD6_9HYPH|nr:glutamate 5-kinase [Sinorhizobium alkalisoli]ODR90886.1 glutamate 5-kinase [Sinorhizobium alkalisoli]